MTFKVRVVEKGGEKGRVGVSETSPNEHTNLRDGMGRCLERECDCSLRTETTRILRS